MSLGNLSVTNQFIQKLTKALKEANERVPYHVRYNFKHDTWEIWEIFHDVVPIVVNIASHDDAEDMCEERNNEWIVRQLVKEMKNLFKHVPGMSMADDINLHTAISYILK